MSYRDPDFVVRQTNTLYQCCRNLSLQRSKTLIFEFLDFPADCKDIVQISVLLGDRKLLPSEYIPCSQRRISGVYNVYFFVQWHEMRFSSSRIGE